MPDAPAARGGAGGLDRAVPLAAWAPAARYVAVAAAYVAGALLLHALAFQLFATGTSATLWYPAAALHLVVVLLYGRRYVPLLALPGLIRYAFGLTGFDLATTLVYAGVIAAVYGAGGVVLRDRLRVDPRLRRFRDAALLLGVGGLVLPLLAALGVTAGARLTGFIGAEAWTRDVLRFWVGDATGIGMLAPLLLTSLARPSGPLRQPGVAAAQGAAVLLTLWLAFGGGRGADLVYAYLMFLPALWVADQRGLSGAAVVVLVANAGAAVALSHRPAPPGPTPLQFHFVLFTFATLFLGASADERRRLLLQARAARLRAERSERLKAQLLANLSHEVRTPLTAIMGFAEVVRDEADAAFAEVAEALLRNGHRVIGTLNAMLEWSMIQAGRARLDLRPVDVRAPVAEAVEGLRAEAARKGLALTLCLPPEPLLAHVEARYLGRVVENLASNAVKFTNAGTVTVRAGVEGPDVVLVVEDTGIGMAPAFLPRVFDPFEQESTGEARRFEGVGLGLAITAEFVEAMGGTIDVESREGEGTTIRVCLPGVPAEA